MPTIFELNAEVRNNMRRGASRRLRRTGLVPAIVYGADKEPLCIEISHDRILQALKQKAFYSHILTLNIADKKEKVVLKEIQRHPYKKQVMHMDFLRINVNKKLRIDVPLHFTGEEDAPGVRDGGTILYQLTEVEVECLPVDLPESIEVDLSKLELNQTIRLSDLKLPKKVELATDVKTEEQNIPVVSIQMITVKEVEEITPVKTEIITAKTEEKLEKTSTKPEE